MVLDVTLHDIDRFEVAPRRSGARSRVPMLSLRALDVSAENVWGPTNGRQDYVTVAGRRPLAGEV